MFSICSYFFTQSEPQCFYYKVCSYIKKRVQTQPWKHDKSICENGNRTSLSILNLFPKYPHHIQMHYPQSAFSILLKKKYFHVKLLRNSAFCHEDLIYLYNDLNFDCLNTTLKTIRKLIFCQQLCFVLIYFFSLKWLYLEPRLGPCQTSLIIGLVKQLKVLTL